MSLLLLVSTPLTLRLKNHFKKFTTQCVDRIFDAETVHERIDFNEEELETFLNSLSPQQFADVQKFFDTMPKLQHEVKFTNPKTKKKNTVTLEGLQSFFA